MSRASSAAPTATRSSSVTSAAHWCAGSLCGVGPRSRGDRGARASPWNRRRHAARSHESRGRWPGRRARPPSTRRSATRRSEERLGASGSFARALACIGPRGAVVAGAGRATATRSTPASECGPSIAARRLQPPVEPPQARASVGGRESGLLETVGTGSAAADQKRKSGTAGAGRLAPSRPFRVSHPARAAGDKRRSSSRCATVVSSPMT